MARREKSIARIANLLKRDVKRTGSDLLRINDWLKRHPLAVGCMVKPTQARPTKTSVKVVGEKMLSHLLRDGKTASNIAKSLCNAAKREGYTSVEFHLTKDRQNGRRVVRVYFMDGGEGNYAYNIDPNAVSAYLGETVYPLDDFRKGRVNIGKRWKKYSFDE